MGRCRWTPERQAAQVGGGKASEVTGWSVPTDGTEITPPQREERKAALFPPALSDAVVGEASEGRHEDRRARHILPQWGPGAADIRSACGFFLRLPASQVAPMAAIFAPVWGSMQGFSVYGTGAAGPGPFLGLLC